MNETLSGGMSYARNLERKEEVGVLRLLEELMGQGFGRRLERKGRPFPPTMSSPWGMAEGCVFGSTFGVGRSFMIFFSFSVCLGS